MFVPSGRDPARRKIASPFAGALLALPLGAIAVAGFEPFGFSAVVVLALALLFWHWSGVHTPYEAFCSGFGFGLGFFLAGVSWIYVSLHTFGAMPMLLAALATLLFCAFLALFPALAGYVVARSARPAPVRLMLIAPAVWVLVEWTRGWIFTGFPWLAVGYSQMPASPLAGYAPVVGAFGVSLAVALTSGSIALISIWVSGWINRRNTASQNPSGALGHKRVPSLRLLAAVAAIAAIAALWLLGFGLKQIAWTQPTGVSTTVDLLQGNVAQDIKWRDDKIISTLHTYRDMVRSSTAQLIVLPETALPLFLHQVPPDYLADLAAHARKNRGDILIGVPERPASNTYFNSVIALGSAGQQVYRKRHLVPFGEFIPLRVVLGWIVNVLSIPLQDFSRGGVGQQPLSVAGQRVAVNICYEDVFGEEIIGQLPQATVLVNASNVAWFGRSIAPQQHLQISQMRAAETGRYMLRATNTGMTAVIDERGYVKAVAPAFEKVTLAHTVPGFRGVTPFVRWGNYAFLLIAGCMLLLAALVARRA
jgi:apolipoprotein N-acyltransferase